LPNQEKKKKQAEMMILMMLKLGKSFKPKRPKLFGNKPI
jgi:hypothetical protein